MIYTVIEDEGPVRVCVNLTKPEVDILEEMVFVESVDFPHSVSVHFQKQLLQLSNHLRSHY